MKKILTLAFCAALAVFAVGAAQSDDHGHEGHGSHMRMMMHGDGGHLGAALDLTDEQKAEARKIHEETFARAEPLMEQAREAMEKVHDLLEGSNPNPTEVGQRMIAAHAFHKQLKALHEDAMARFSALLTAEQLEKFKEMQEKHGEDHERFLFPGRR